MCAAWLERSCMQRPLRVSFAQMLLLSSRIEVHLSLLIVNYFSANQAAPQAPSGRATSYRILYRSTARRVSISREKTRSKHLASNDLSVEVFNIHSLSGYYSLTIQTRNNNHTTTTTTNNNNNTNNNDDDNNHKLIHIMIIVLIMIMTMIIMIMIITILIIPIIITMLIIIILLLITILITIIVILILITIIIITKYEWWWY